MENIQVACYSGYRAEESPVHFYLGERKVQVRQIIDRWMGKDHRYFKVRGDDGAIYILRHENTADIWTLTMYETTGQ